MLSELGFIGTIGEDDEVPVEPESDSGDDEEEVGAGRRDWRGREPWAGAAGKELRAPGRPQRAKVSPGRLFDPDCAEATSSPEVSLASCPFGDAVSPSVHPASQAAVVALGGGDVVLSEWREKKRKLRASRCHLPALRGPSDGPRPLRSTSEKATL